MAGGCAAWDQSRANPASPRTIHKSHAMEMALLTAIGGDWGYGGILVAASGFSRVFSPAGTTARRELRPS